MAETDRVTVDKAWDLYRKDKKVCSCAECQRDAKDAFYAGAYAGWFAIISMVATPGIAIEAIERFNSTMAAEFRAYFADLVAQRQAAAAKSKSGARVH